MLSWKRQLAAPWGGGRQEGGLGARCGGCCSSCHDASLGEAGRCPPLTLEGMLREVSRMFQDENGVLERLLSELRAARGPPRRTKTECMLADASRRGSIAGASS